MVNSKAQKGRRMNKEKMLELADLLEKIEPESFHMSTWFGEITTFEAYENSQWIDEDIVETYNLQDKNLINSISSYYRVLDDTNDPEDKRIKIACGTTACIAGWTIVNEYYTNSANRIEPEYGAYETKAMEILGLSAFEAAQLFYCDWGSLWYRYADEYGLSFDTEQPETWGDVHPKHAADILRRLANEEIKFRTKYDDDEESWSI